MADQRQAVEWRSRIVRTGKIHASQLSPHSENPKVHPKAQQDAVAGSLSELGQIAPILINVNNGELVDGHERAWLALAQPDDPELDAVWVDLTEEEHAKALLMLDYTARLATYDRDKVDTLLHTVNSDKPDVQRLLADVAEKHGRGIPAHLLPPPDDDDPELDFDADGVDLLTRFDVPDALWATDNEYDVPLLDINMQADAVDLPLKIWGHESRYARMSGTWAFYTDDYRFGALWVDPSKVLHSRAVNAIEPNFTTGEQMPFAVCLWNIYRKRWVARWWQSRGLRIFVDLNVHPKLYALNLYGVPKGWTAYATRGYTAQLELLDREHALACEHAGTTSLLFIVYGGGKEVQAHCKQKGLVWFDEVMTLKRERERNNGSKE